MRSQTWDGNFGRAENRQSHNQRLSKRLANNPAPVLGFVRALPHSAGPVFPHFLHHVLYHEEGLFKDFSHPAPSPL
jgi:hypothetical protein